VGAALAGTASTAAAKAPRDGCLRSVVGAGTLARTIRFVRARGEAKEVAAAAVNTGGGCLRLVVETGIFARMIRLVEAGGEAKVGAAATNAGGGC
jgi:hypothetical protein